MSYARPVPPVAPTYNQTNHTVHLVLSIVTCGAWLLVWPIVAVVNSQNNKSKRESYDQALAQYTRDLQLYEESRAAD